MRRTDRRQQPAFAPQSFGAERVDSDPVVGHDLQRDLLLIGIDGQEDVALGSPIEKVTDAITGNLDHTCIMATWRGAHNGRA